MQLHKRLPRQRQVIHVRIAVALTVTDIPVFEALVVGVFRRFELFVLDLHDLGDLCM